MPQFKVKLKEIITGDLEEVTVWAENKRQAGLQATRIAKKLLAKPSFDIVETTDMSPAHHKPKLVHAREHRKDQHGPVAVRFISV